MANHFCADCLSIFAVVYSVAPVLVFLVSRNLQHIRWAIAVLAAPLVAEAIKRGTKLLGLEQWAKRPAGARDCDTWNRNGAQGGAPGFPSGHTATTAAFWVGAWILTDSPLVLFVGLIATVVMGFARLQKRCHTLLQVVGGAVLGFLVSVLCLKSGLKG